MLIKISDEFSKTPGGRYTDEGDYSGQEFREKLLEVKFLDAVKNNENLIVDLDGCVAFPPSFLEEAFGGLVRKLKTVDILNRIEIVCVDQPSLEKKIKNFILKELKNEKLLD